MRGSDKPLEHFVEERRQRKYKVGIVDNEIVNGHPQREEEVKRSKNKQQIASKEQINIRLDGPS